MLRHAAAASAAVDVLCSQLTQQELRALNTELQGEGSTAEQRLATVQVRPSPFPPARPQTLPAPGWKRLPCLQNVYRSIFHTGVIHVQGQIELQAYCIPHSLPRGQAPTSRNPSVINLWVAGTLNAVRIFVSKRVQDITGFFVSHAWTSVTSILGARALPPFPPLHHSTRASNMLKLRRVLGGVTPLPPLCQWRSQGGTAHDCEPQP